MDYKKEQIDKIAEDVRRRFVAGSIPAQKLEKLYAEYNSLSILPQINMAVRPYM